MKTSRCLLICIIMCIVPGAIIKAQCTGASTSTIITYDSTVTGVGSAPYVFTFPKFNPALGTLTSIRVQSVVTLLYTFSLENSEAGTREVDHYLNRLDRISSTALTSTINNSFTSDPFGPYSLDANDGVTGSGTDYVHVASAPVLFNDTLVNRNLFNTASFMGPGTVTFNYITIPGSTTYGASVNHSPSVTDIIKFNISYIYCNALSLASNLINLDAAPAGPLSAMVKWTTSNELEAVSYEVMVSRDGINFTTAVIIPAKGTFANNLGSYQYKYEFNDAVKTLYFRIKQLTKNNKPELTAIKPVSWQQRQTEVHFIADRSGNAINTNLPTAGGASWIIDLFGVNGQLLQREQVRAGVSVNMPIKKQLQSGVYVIRAVNSMSKEVITQKLFIQ
ncbi:MAG: choice-of-anchor E domain-containing protein [Chitinophagaceae bacterium]|nr:MAG: choice-of-anchor E domain-containing protein [Chitinophagaceae bacterium]